MKYNMNYIRFLSGVITEEQFISKEPINELFGYGASTGDDHRMTRKGDIPKKALEFTDMLKQKLKSIADHGEPEQIEKLNALHHDTMDLNNDIMDIADRIEELMYAKKAYPSSSGGSSIGMKRSSGSPRGIYGFGGA